MYKMLVTCYCDVCCSEPGSVGLMVDKLTAQLGNQGLTQWFTKAGTQQYPPSSLHVSFIMKIYHTKLWNVDYDLYACLLVSPCFKNINTNDIMTWS